jgi:hypothetical protein
VCRPPTTAQPAGGSTSGSRYLVSQKSTRDFIEKNQVFSIKSGFWYYLVYEEPKNTTIFMRKPNLKISKKTQKKAPWYLPRFFFLYFFSSAPLASYVLSHILGPPALLLLRLLLLPLLAAAASAASYTTGPRT